MKTVGEFKKMGLIFVKGDHTIESDGSSSKGDIDFNTDLNFNKYNYFDSSPILEFAWRESTGVKPEFVGLVDVKFSTGATLSGYDKNLLGWNKAGAALPIIEWRPSMNQPKKWPDNSRIDIIGQNGNYGLHYDNTAQQVEELAVNNKPIFTQAMAAAYKMPAIGSWFTLHYHEHGSRFNDMDGHDFEVIGINDDIYTFRSDIKGYGALKLNAINCTPIDTRTDREKAIDAALHEWPVADKATLEMAYDFWRVGEI